MGGMCSTPAPPDFNAQAQAQGAANVETAQTEAHLNRPDVYTPYGSQTWQKDPYGNDPNQYIMRQTLSPVEQQKLDLANSAQVQGLAQLERYGPTNIYKALSSSYSLPGQAMMGLDPRYTPDQAIQTDSGFWSAAPQQEDLNLAAAPGMPTADAETRRQITNALFRQGASYLDPQFEGLAAGMKSDLSNQGIFLGSEGYNAAIDNFNRQRTQAYGDLRDRAIAAGGEEMARDFGLGMQAHQQGVSDIAQAGTFHNQARQDMVSQLLADMQARNSALVSSGNMAAQSADAYNQGRSMQLNENAQAAMLPINMQNAILTGSQVNNPNFQPYANTQIAPPPIFQGAQAQWGASMDSANAKNQMIGQGIGAAAGIAGMAML